MAPGIGKPQRLNEMNNEQRDNGLIIKMPSALLATLLLLFIGMLFLRNWNERTAIALLYVAVLAFSGWIFALWTIRIAGIIHSLLMFGIAGFCFYGVLFTEKTPLADNPAAGVDAIATVVGFTLGVIASLCGIGAAYLVFKKNKS